MLANPYRRMRHILSGMGVGIHDEPISFWHTGSARDISTVIAWSDRGQAVISVALVGEGDAMDIAVALSEALDDLVAGAGDQAQAVGLTEHL